MCDCFKEKLKLVTEHIKKDLTDFEKETFHSEWVGYSFFLDGKPHVPVNPKVAYEYKTKKRNGDVAKNLKKNDVSMLARYCPFCGEDTKKDENKD